MKVKIKPGKYLLAVSGGVDSMVLLDVLAKQATGDRLRMTEKSETNSNLTSNLQLVVAHFNHGIREESGTDEEFVRHKAAQLGLEFVSEQGNLGKGASEEVARAARYKFLFNTQRNNNTQAIITAHHQDDLIETALINLLRGTGRKGLVAIQNNPHIIRPLLQTPKQKIIEYANTNCLEWREDKTNQDNRYLRNYIRNHLQDNLTRAQREEILKNIDKVAKMSNDIDKLIAKLSQSIIVNNQINRTKFTSLPVNLGEELMIYWLRQNQLRQFDKRTINRLCLALRNYQPGKTYEVTKDLRLKLSQKTAKFS